MYGAVAGTKPCDHAYTPPRLTTLDDHQRRIQEGRPVRGTLRNGVPWRFWGRRFEVRPLLNWLPADPTLLETMG